MSTRTPTQEKSHIYDSTSGANALKIAPIPAHVPEQQEPKRRITLSIVPGLARRRRVPFMLLIAGIMLAAVIGMLVLNISMANGQYSVVGFKGQERSLSQENEALRQEVNFLQAPQNVAKKAAKLGMVEPGVPAAIDLATGKVTGKATPAKKGESEKLLIKAPSKPKNEVTAPHRSTAATQQQQTVPAQPSTAGNQQEGTTAPEEAVRTGTGTRPAFTAEELNGGTIPAPTVRTSGN
ncbi:hypothetical protein [Paeniglutamicibacter cryotolerans]|nr:hypothetical protein [Paeniglutamicibacter cryotolerans]